MSSFYGGKQGRTYNIVQRYDSVEDMCKAFANGGAYTEVNYGQYVIIDTTLKSRSNIENGALYRRGFDYLQTIKPIPKRESFPTDNDFISAYKVYIQRPGAGAIYVGKIVGPEGRTPQITLEHWERFIGQQKGSSQDQNTVYGGKSTLALDCSSTVDQPSGRDNDEIKVGYINVEDKNGNTYGAYLSAQVPRLEIDVTLDTNAYHSPGVVQNSESTTHPFWYKWDFTVPSGKQGKSINDIKIEDTYDTGKGQYRLTSDVIINSKKTYYVLQNGQYEKVENPVQENLNTYYQADQFFTYSLLDYTSASTGDIVQQHSGCWPYKVIDKITPVLRVRSVLNSTSWRNIQSVIVGTLYREENRKYPNDTYWVCIQAGKILNARTPLNPIEEGREELPRELPLGYEDQITYRDQVTGETGKTIWRLVTIPNIRPSKSLNVDYTYGPDDEIYGLRNVDYLTVDKNGKMYVTYSDSDTNESYYLTTVHELESITYDSSTASPNYGKVMIKYNDSSQENVLYDPNVLERIYFKNQDDITNTDGQYFSAKYKRKENSEVSISERINRILDVQRYGDSLICLYSDPTIRAASTVGTEGKDWCKLDWKDPVTGTRYEGDNALIWKSFGPIGSQFHFQGVYTYSQLLALNETGFGGEGTENRAGWIATVIDNNTIKLYAYDYNDDTENGKYSFPDPYSSDPESTVPTRWYQVMSVAESVVAKPDYSILVSEENSSNLPVEKYTDLKEGGLWFVVSGGHDN